MSNERLVRQLAVLSALAREEQLQTGDFTAALRHVAETVAQTLGVERVGIWRFNSDRSAIRCLELYELSPHRHSSGLELRVDEHPRYFAALAATEVVAADDARLDSRTRELTESYLKPFGIVSMMGAPVHSANGLDGVLCHEHVGSARQWGMDEKMFAVAVANLVSLVISRWERKQTEETLRESEELLRQAQKMEAVGKLAGGIAHDFNNLLTIVSGYSELLLKRLERQDPMRKHLEEIKKAGDRAASLTRQLLAFSRRQVLIPKALDLNAIVEGMGAMLQRLLGEDIDLATALDPTLWHVKADPGQLEQIIMNLAVNARDAMPQGGKLTIETANIQFKEARVREQHEQIMMMPGRYAMLAVSDTGIGMDAGTHARIFEPFFTTKAIGKGTGLGLATVYGIVKQSGGYIFVYSEPGRGATFKIYLPKVDETVEAVEKEPVFSSSPRGTETVLLVEDEPGVRVLARDTLQLQGYTVLEARHGIEALLISHQHVGSIHLLVTDVVMPQMSGREVAEQLIDRHPSLKVLYVSGYTENAIVHHGVLDPGIAFLQKPFTPDVLVRKVRDVLDAPAVSPSRTS